MDGYEKGKKFGRYRLAALIVALAVPAVLTAAVFAAPASAPCQTEDERKAALLKECGEGYQVRQTAHWFIVFKAEAKWVDDTAAMLERTHDLYFEQFKKAGLEPRPLEEKLVCILVGSQEDFAKYMEGVRKSTSRPDGPARPSDPSSKGSRRLGAGSYSGQTNRIQMCDIRALPRGGGKPAGGARADLENLARTAHEAAHQLSFNTGVLKAGPFCPMWLGEGLAANFEFTDPAKPFGPLTDNLSPRAGRLKQLFAEGKLVPLKEFLTQSPAQAHQDENRGPNYFEGWGLFRFLITERPAQLKAYLAALAALPRGLRGPGQALSVFETAFGPLEEVEKDWQAFLKRLGGDPAVPATQPNAAGDRP